MLFMLPDSMKQSVFMSKQYLGANSAKNDIGIGPCFDPAKLSVYKRETS